MALALLVSVGCSFDPPAYVGAKPEDGGPNPTRDGGPLASMRDAGLSTADAGDMDGGDPSRDGGTNPTRDGGANTPRDAGPGRDGGVVGCGDGVLQQGEECDDDNNAPDDGCSPSCEIEDGWCCDTSFSPTDCQLFPELSMQGERVTEGDDAEVRAWLDVASACPVVIDWSTTDGTATAPDDYPAAQGTATILAGTTETTFTVMTSSDNVAEAREDFFVEVDDAEGADVVDGSARIFLDDAPVFVNDGLLVRYFFDEVGSGVSMTAFDAGPTPALDLSRSASTNGPTYLTTPEGRGLSWLSAGGNGWMGSVANSKFYNAIDNGQRATIEVVVNVDDASSQLSRLFQYGDSQTIVCGLLVSDTQVVFAVNNNTSIRWDIDLRLRPGPTVLTVVYDSTRSLVGDRIDFYIDGQTAPSSDFGPGPGWRFNALQTDTLVVGNRFSGNRSIEGEIFYMAIYDEPMSAAEVAQNATILLGTHDSP